MERNRRVWPVGAVSNTTTEKWSSFTKLSGEGRSEHDLLCVCVNDLPHDLHEALGLINPRHGVCKLCH